MARWYGGANCKVCICLKVLANFMNKPRLSRYVVIFGTEVPCSSVSRSS